MHALVWAIIELVPQKKLRVACSPPMLEQGPSEPGRVLEPIRDRLSVADNSTSYIEK